MIREWFRKRRQRMEESHAATETSLTKRDHIARQWPEVHRAAHFSREQRRINHLSELIFNIHQGRS